MNVVCDPCDCNMDLLFQAKDSLGKDVFTYHCPKCGGRAAVQDEQAQAPPVKPLRPVAQHQMQIELASANAPTVNQIRSSVQPAHRVQ